MPCRVSGSLVYASSLSPRSAARPATTSPPSTGPRVRRRAGIQNAARRAGTRGGAVDALAVSGSTVPAGGFFDHIGSQSRDRIAAIDSGDWRNGFGTENRRGERADPGWVSAVAVSGSTVYAGGRLRGDRRPAAPRRRRPRCRATRRSRWNPSAPRRGRYPRRLRLDRRRRRQIHLVGGRPGSGSPPWTGPTGATAGPRARSVR